MRHNFLKTLLFSLSIFVFSCTQKPASIVVHATTSPQKAGFVSNNPYKTVVQKGDTLYSIARKNNVEIRSIIEENNLRPPYILIVGQTVKLPKATFHIVGQNDNLYAISRSYGVDISRLAKKNNLEAPYNLTKGQKLLLPSPAEKDNDSMSASKEIKYNFGTKETRASSSVVAASELAPIGKKNKKLTTAENDESPFATEVVESQKTVSAKKAIEPVKEAENKEETDFMYKSEQEFAPSTHSFPAPINTIKSKNNVTDKLNTNDKINTVSTFPPDNYNSEPEEKTIVEKTTITKSSPSQQNKTNENAEDSPFIEKESTSTNSPEKPANSVKPNFNWPVKGKIISNFGPKNGGLYNDGINIAAKEGAPIKAADDGEVVYCGNELRGYGNMLLIKHNNGYLTAYAHTDDFLVKKGDMIKKGQIIAHVGQTGHVASPQLHFSIRQGRKAIDPQKYLSSS